MDSLLQVLGASKSFGVKDLFQDAAFAINAGEHVGVIGPNGAGKSTLFRIIVGEDRFDRGDVVRSGSLRLGYLAQYDRTPETMTVEEFVTSNVPTPAWDLRKWGKGLGLDDARFAAPLSSLSGGYRMRAKLLRLLGEQPNLMLLDEPTNYLDLETLLVLENFLREFEGAFLLISHDREFLRRTTDTTLDVEGGSITKYPGNVDEWLEQKSLIREQLEKQALSQDAKRQKILDFAARFGAKATKARQVQSRLKLLDRMTTVDVKPLPVGARIKIPEPGRMGKLALRLDRARIGYGEREILRDVDLEISSGDHWGVVGLNGAGKSTLLRALAGELGLMGGKRETGHGVAIGYYHQHVGEALDPDKSVLECLRLKAHPDLNDQQILDMAGSLLFSGSDVQKKIRVLSGGEKARVALGQILLSRSPCLLLDEPTNHLDFYTVEALTLALAEYPGTVIIVSHDQAFIKRIATRIIEINRGLTRTYPGSYDEYVWSMQKALFEQDAVQVEKKKDQKSDRTPETQSGTQASGVNHRLAREERRAKENRLKQLTRTVARCEEKIAAAEATLAELNEAAAENPSDQTVIFKLAETHRALQEHEAAWTSASEEAENLAAELGATPS